MLLPFTCKEVGLFEPTWLFAMPDELGDWDGRGEFGPDGWSGHKRYTHEQSTPIPVLTRLDVE